MQKPITLGSLFDGIGGFPYAASFYGIKTLWASEILPVAISVTRRHFSEMKHVGDITKLSGELLPPVDIITFGSPCQDLSVAAGHRAGLDGARSGLFTEAIRIINEMRVSTYGNYPKYAVWENVPGALNSRHGLDFQAVLSAFADTEIPMPPSGRWANAGMVRRRGSDVAWCVYNAAEFGLAQRRKRVFAVTDFTGTNAGKILFIPKGLPWYFAAGGKEGQGVTAALAGGSDGTGAYSLTAGSFMKVCKEQAPTLAARDYKDPTIVARPQNSVTKTYGVCSVNSNSMKSANPDSGFYEADTSRTLDTNGGNPGCNQGGMLVAAFMGRASSGAGSVAYSETEAPTLRAGMTPCVCEPEIARTLTARGDSSPCADRGQNIICVASSQADASINDNLCPTITGAAGTSGDNTPYIVREDTPAYGFDLQQITSKTNRSTLKEVQPSLCAASNPHVVHPDKTGTLCASAAGLSRPGGQASETDLTVAYCLQGNMIGREDNNGPQGGGVNEEISYTLNGTDKHSVAYAMSTGHYLSPTKDKTPTLIAGANKDRLIVCSEPSDISAIPINMQVATRCEALGEGTALGIGKEGDPAYTLQETHCHAVAAGTFGQSSFGGFSEHSATLTVSGGSNGGGSENLVVNTPFVVRRLTPTECERLQGFPDGWTATDADGKEISDSKRYQMLGNSVAIPCVAHIMRGIAETMQGGFDT